MFSFLVGLFLPFLWVAYFWSKDKNKEPVIYLVLAFILGIISAYLSLIAEKVFDDLIEKEVLRFFVFSFIEEFFKFFVIWVFIFSLKIFDEPIDAMIYMMFSALGFAVIENFHLFIQSDWNSILFLAFSRFLGASFVHILASSLIGYGYGYYFKTRRLFLFFVSFLAGIFLHFVYNIIVFNFATGLFFVLPILWSAFLVVLNELNYLALIDERGKRN